MRRWSWSPLLNLTLAVASGCALDTRASIQLDPAVQLELHEGLVTCDARAQSCRDSAGQISPGERYKVKARVGFRPAEARLSFTIRRPAHIDAIFDARFPLTANTVSSTPSIVPSIRYREVDAQTGRVLFEASAFGGRIELSLDNSCPCQTGRMDLVMRSAGPDGQLGTADDDARRITRARIRRDNRPFCHKAEIVPTKTDLLVVGVRNCPMRTRSRQRGGACAWGGGGWLPAASWNDGWYDDGWVGLYPNPDGSDRVDYDAWGWFYDDDWQDEAEDVPDDGASDPLSEWGNDDWGDYRETFSDEIPTGTGGDPYGGSSGWGGGDPYGGSDDWGDDDSGWGDDDSGWGDDDSGWGDDDGGWDDDDSGWDDDDDG